MDNAEKYMERAIELARMGAGRVSPNPMVGALIVKNGEIIGEGYHHKFGYDHAEVDAIKYCRRLGNDPSGARMYVSLEPCCHHGKTPPCTDAIIKAGIKSVEIATTDDYKEVSGRGIEVLRSAGLEVSVGLCGQQARDLNYGFFKRLKTGKPCVILKWAQSIDGKITFCNGDERRWFTGSEARIDVHKIRNYCDAIMIGRVTCMVDDPMLNVRLLDVEDAVLKRIVLDSNLSLPLDRKLFNSTEAGPVFIMTAKEALSRNAEKAEVLENKGCELIAVGVNDNGQLNLEDVLIETGKLGVCNLMVEGGSQTLNSFITQKQADKAVIYVAPLVVGNCREATRIDFCRGFNLAKVKNRLIESDLIIEGDIAYL